MDNITQSYQLQLTDHTSAVLSTGLGNLRAVINNQEIVTNYSDYFPFGMQLPGRSLSGSNGYRYGYQGDYAEKEETGSTNSFELRLWDSRIGRWMSPDPYGQYHSPYLGMGNNPINAIDSDGGYVYYYGNKITNKHFITILATAIGSETLKDYIISPNKHIHIGTIDGHQCLSR